MSTSGSGSEVDVDAVARSIADEVGGDPAEVREGLENLIDYSVPLDEAKRTIRRRFGGDGPSEGDGGDTARDEAGVREIGSLSPDDDRVTVEALVLCAGPRTIVTGGEPTTIVEGELADGSDRIAFTSWESFEADPGDAVRIAGAGVKEWNGAAQINLGSRSSVTVVDGDAVAVDVAPYGVRDLDAVEDGDRDVVIEVRVIEAEKRDIDGRDGPTTIGSGVLADGSGRLPYTDWEDRGLEEGACYRIANAYVDEYRGMAQVNLGEHTAVEPCDAVPIDDEPSRTTVADAVAGGGAYDVAIAGDVIAVKDGSGLVDRCPDCGRVVQNDRCKTHGDVDAETDMRVKAVLDDGTAAVTLVLDRELSERVYGGTLDDAVEEAREAMDQGVVMETVADRIVGRRWRVRGNVSVGDYGANMEATALDRVDGDATEAAREALDEFL